MFPRYWDITWVLTNIFCVGIVAFESYKFYNWIGGEQVNVERWLAKVAETDRLCTQVFAEAKKCLENGIIQVKDPKFVSPITDVLVSELEKHFGGLDPLYGYASFHPLIGSTPVFDFTPDFDLPGGEIVQFTKDLLERLQRANETGVFES